MIGEIGNLVCKTQMWMGPAVPEDSLLVMSTDYTHILSSAMHK